MLSLLKNFFWPQRQQTEVGSLHPFPEGNRKRRPSRTEEPIDNKKSRGLEGSAGISWNLDLEQADYRFSKETLSIFKGSGATVLVSRQANQNFSQHRSQQSVVASPLSRIFGSVGSRASVAPLSYIHGQPVVSARQDESIGLSQAALSILRQAGSNSPTAFHASTMKPTKSTASGTASTAASAAAVAAVPTAAPCVVHSTPMIASSDRVASTVPKPAPAEVRLRAGRKDQDDDDDCIITSVEGPKSVAEIFAPCKYLSTDWLEDIKTSSQSLKTYMQKVETEESLKMQYWAKKRESDERDLVARVTRNLKLAERELPVLPYKYEEPPPTPPPSPPAVEEEEEFVELTDAQLDAVQSAWSRQLPGNEVLAEGFSLRVTRDELRSFSGLNWLNDNVVNFYMQLVAARTGPGLAKVHAFSTFFFTKLSSSGYASVRRWTRKVDIFDRDVLLCPVHLHNNHWTICIIDIRSRHIIYLDSLSHGSSGSPSCLPLLRQYLVDEHRDKKGSELDAGEFQLVHDIGAPRQENGSDCGVFCCKYADYYCKGREFTFSQVNMPYFRKRSTVEILEKRLLW